MNEPTPRRLPQVGERWKTRSGITTKPLETNENGAYRLGAYCSDGLYRSWTIDGHFWFDNTFDSDDLVELVTENEESYYKYLCVRDQRNPLHSDIYQPGDEVPPLSDPCACDNCHYGRTKLALVIIDLLGKDE